MWIFSFLLAILPAFASYILKFYWMHNHLELCPYDKLIPLLSWNNLLLPIIFFALKLTLSHINIATSASFDYLHFSVYYPILFFQSVLFLYLKCIYWPGMVAHACKFSTLRDWVEKIPWVQELVTSLGNIRRSPLC